MLVQDIKPRRVDYNKMEFQIEYFIEASQAGMFFIKGCIPSGINPNPHFRCKPAGLYPAGMPTGIPKGRHSLSENIVFLLEYTGIKSYRSSTIEMVIQDQNQKPYYATILKWSHLWPGSLDPSEAWAIPCVKLEQSLFATGQEEPQLDQDQDGLIDGLENIIADKFSPYCIFDDAEIAREPYEPVTIFQVCPLSKSRIRITWVFLFRKDGGYGPDSWGEGWDDHEGDNDTIFYELETNDNGYTWTLVRICLSKGGRVPDWTPASFPLELYDGTHPVIYMSASKHHMYINKNNDHHDSAYSDYGYNDDVNGLGDRILVDLLSLKGVYYNNVGEIEHHPSPPFMYDFGPFYEGHSAWGHKFFYEVGPTVGKWMLPQGKYMGNLHHLRVHKLPCKWASMIKKSNRLPCSTLYLYAQGYDECDHCLGTLGKQYPFTKV